MISCVFFVNPQTISLSSLSLNFVQMLQEIAQEANFVVTYVDIEELSVSGEDTIFSTVILVHARLKQCSRIVEVSKLLRVLVLRNYIRSLVCCCF